MAGETGSTVLCSQHKQSCICFHNVIVMMHCAACWKKAQIKTREDKMKSCFPVDFTKRLRECIFFFFFSFPTRFIRLAYFLLYFKTVL